MGVLLWIAFRIVFLLMIPNTKRGRKWIQTVVNCFQNCIFTYDSQPQNDFIYHGVSCELLSELYFYLWFPTFGYGRKVWYELWIAFRIVFLLMIPNNSVNDIREKAVVNCFQNCIFTYDSQHWSGCPSLMVCCELLSELYFYLWFPTWEVRSCWWNGLWIAFRIVFLLMIPNLLIK